MSFIQNLFTSRDNNAQGNTFVGQEGRLWWDPDRNGIYYSDGSTPGGILVGYGGNATPGGPINSVQINDGAGNFAGSSSLTFSSNVLAVGGNVTANYFIGNVSTTGNIVGGNILSNNYLYANGNSIFANIALTGNIDLGNLYIIDETIYGKNVNQDIVLSPAGSAYVDVPRLKVAVGSLIQGQAQVNPIIASVTLNQVLANSSGPADTLPVGSYGNPQGVTAPWAVYQFTTVPSPVLQVNDVIAGTGVPVPSIVQWVGNTSGTDAANANVVVTTGSYSDLPTPIPGTGNVITITRAVTLAGLDIISTANTTINLLPGTAGNVIIGSSMLPAVNNAFDLGSPTARWRSIYFGGNTIYVYDPVLGVDQSISASNGNLVVAGGTGLNVGSFTFFGNTIAIADPDEDIFIGTDVATGNVDFRRPIRVLSNVAFPYPTFEVDRDGLTTINVNSALPANVAALNVNGAASGNSYPRNFSATLVQLTNLDREPARISMDSFGANVITGQNAYGLLAARVARGTVDAPAQTQAGDVMMRLTSQGFNNAGAFQGSIVRYNQVATGNITTASAATRHNFQATPAGTVTIKNIANIDAQGLTFSSAAAGGPANTGITFQDGSYQNTAYIANQAVNSLTAGVGLVVSAATGNITIDNTGVITAQGTANQIAVNGSYAAVTAGNIVLSLPQDIAPTSNVTFNNVTAGNVTVLGNLTYANVDTVDSYRLYLANNSTASGQINGGGIILGNVSNGTYWRSILYDQNTDAWSVQGDYGAGNLIAGNIQADFTNVTELAVQGNAHFGNAYTGYDFPNAVIHATLNVNGYAQTVAQNINPGGDASTDIVAVNDIGDDSNNYIDMGINSNAYANLDYAVTRANDGYLYVNGGNLIIGTQTAAKTILFFTGGTNATSYIRGTVNDTGLSMVGTVTANNFTGNTVSVATVTATGNVNAANVLAITVTATNVVGTNITGTLQTAAQNNITSVGTLTSLSVTGTVKGGNIATAGNVSATGNVTGSNLVTSGTIVNSGIVTTGTISAFGNITSSANVTGANVITNRVVGSGLTLSSTGNLVFAPTGNINANTHYINNVINPVQAQDAATKNYVDTTIASSIVNADWTATSGTAEIINKTGASGPTTIALGQNAAGNVQGSGAIAIGVGAAGSATTSQGVDAIAIGTNAGGALAQAQGDATIAIGKNAGGAGFGTDGQQTWSIAIGTEAGTSNQAAYSVALGAYAGRYNQGSYATALGQAAGLQSQGTGAVAIGQAGYESQGQYAVAIGSGAGDTNQGNNAIAIGYQAGTNNQTANSIILNASDSALDSSGVAGLFINPVRNNLSSNANVVFFNTSTKELTYANTILLTGNITGANLVTGGLITATGNVQGGNIRTAGVVTATGTVTGGNIATGGTVSAGGNVTGGNIRTAGVVSATSTVTGGNLATGGTVSATGNITGGNIRTAGVVSATGNITANYFFGNGSQLTGITGTGITTITPNALSSIVHIAANTVGNTATIITDATTANTANTIVVRDANGAINVSGWTVGARLTAVDYTATTSDYWIGTSAKNRTITLPNAANGASNGRQYQIADTVHSGNPNTTIAAQSPATVTGNQPSQQGQIILATYIGGVWYLN